MISRNNSSNGRSSGSVGKNDGMEGSNGSRNLLGSTVCFGEGGISRGKGSAQKSKFGLCFVGDNLEVCKIGGLTNNNYNYNKYL